MTGTSFELGMLSNLFKFEAFRVTKKNFILYHGDEKLVIPRTLIKFNYVGIPANQMCFLTEGENE